MKSLSVYARRRLTRLLAWGAVLGLGVGVYLAYRWAEPSPQAMAAAHNASGGGVTIRLDDTPFAGYIDGARAWSLHAGQVNIVRMPNSSLSNVQSATLVDIRDGALFEPPPRTSLRPASTTNIMEATGASSNDGRVAATFRAKQGLYSVGMLSSIPADLEMLYTVQWQFKLSGDVVFRTRARDELSAPSMTIYTLVNRRTGKSEQRVICEQGARMRHREIQVTANHMRFNPKDRTVECLSGVRGVYKQGSVQADRVFWTLDDETLRCPETATGMVMGMPFVAEGLTLDIKHGRHHANHIHVQPRIDTVIGDQE